MGFLISILPATGSGGIASANRATYLLWLLIVNVMRAYFNALLHWFFVTPPAHVKTGMGGMHGVEASYPRGWRFLSANVIDASGDGGSGTGTILWLLRQIITLNGRNCWRNPLSGRRTTATRWILPTERLFRHERPPLMILCNPHNPTGRAGRPTSWSSCFYYVKLMMSLSSRMKYGPSIAAAKRYLGTAFRGALA